MRAVDMMFLGVLMMGYVWLTWSAFDVFLLGHGDPVMESCRGAGISCPAIPPSVLGLIINLAGLLLLFLLYWVGEHPIKDEVK